MNNLAKKSVYSAVFLLLATSAFSAGTTPTTVTPGTAIAGYASGQTPVQYLIKGASTAGSVCTVLQADVLFTPSANVAGGIACGTAPTAGIALGFANSQGQGKAYLVTTAGGSIQELNNLRGGKYASLSEAGTDAQTQATTLDGATSY
jgi:hypothetical protein